MSDNKAHASLSAAGWLAVGILIGFFAGAIWSGIYSWDSLGELRMSAFGWFTLIAGSLFTIGVGGGLMALVYFSNRKKFDR